MNNDVFGLIYTGERNAQLRDLTFSRSIAAVPFGGRYRCIDFILSSMVNSGIFNVGIITQKNYHSLIDHLGSGKEWDLHRKHDGLFILPPFVTKDNVGIYKGTADALASCLGYIRRSEQKYLLLSGSHTIYNTVYDKMISQHISTGADITIMCCDETGRRQSYFQYDELRLAMDSDGKISDMVIDPFENTLKYRSCDAFLMEKSLMEELIEDAKAHANHDFIRDVLLQNSDKLNIYGYCYEGTVARLDSLSDYFYHNMALLNKSVRDDLFCREHPIYTKVKDEASARYGENACVKNSLIADGCEIDGTVENSILFRGVKVGKGSVLKNCIVLQASRIENDVSADTVIMDKSVIVSKGSCLKGCDSYPMILPKNSII